MITHDLKGRTHARQAFYLDSSLRADGVVVVARATIPATNAFWSARFDVESATDDLPHTCPAATPNILTLCVMPR